MGDIFYQTCLGLCGCENLSVETSELQKCRAMPRSIINRDVSVTFPLDGYRSLTILEQLEIMYGESSLLYTW